MARTATIDDLLLHVSPSALQAHAGGWSCEITTIDTRADAASASLWSIDAEGGQRQLAETGYGAAWARDGSRMAFLRSVGSGTEAFVLDAASGRAEQVSDMAGALASIEQFDAEGGRLLVRRVETACDTGSPWAIDALPIKQDGVAQLGCQLMRLGVLTLASGDYADCITEGGDVLEACWDPSLQRLAYVQRRCGREQHWMDLWLKAGDAAPVRLTHDLPSISTLSWSPDGRHLAFAASDTEGDSVTWLHLVEPSGGGGDRTVRRFGIEMALPGAIQWEASGERMVVNEAARGLQRIVGVPLQGAPTVLYEEEGVHVLEVAVHDDRVGFIAQGVNENSEVWLTRPGEGRPRRLTGFNAWRRERVPLAYARRGFRVPDGTGGEEDIDGWLLRPDGEGPFPLLLDMHGGPHVPATLCFEKHPHWPVLVQQGWAVLALNAVGSSSYGRAFARRLVGHWGELDFPQWEAAVRSLQAEGIASSHVAAFGHSYGGFLAAWALTHAPWLASGVVSAGVINQASHAGTSDSGHYVGPFSMGGELHEVRDRYRALSPITHAHRIRAPVLLLQGLEDQRCPVGQSEELFTAVMRATDAPARLVRFPGGDHHAATTGTPSHRVVYFRELVDWLERWRHAERSR